MGSPPKKCLFLSLRPLFSGRQKFGHRNIKAVFLTTVVSYSIIFAYNLNRRDYPRGGATWCSGRANMGKGSGDFPPMYV